ncbi:MAG TPA: hypothetical protein VK327_16495, partial [Candidatus Paceibacterota bacterium]|nr:hypothetical protein [Candidatus Paceibacterota bacterium]
MNNRENRRYEMFHRSKAFGQTNTADFPPDGEAARRFTNLSAILIGLDKARASQQGGGTTAKSVLMDALKLDIQNITRTARAMDQDTPGLADKFPAPTR